MAKRNTVDHILQIATEQFASVGYEGARMDKIATQAEINKATIYYHFKDKAALYESVLSRIFSSYEADVITCVHPEYSPSENLKSYMKAFVTLIDTYPLTPSIMLREIADGGKRLPKSIQEQIVAIVKTLVVIINEGIETGAFRKVNPFVVHLTVVSSMQFYYSTIRIREGGEFRGIGIDPSLVRLTMDEYAEQLFEIIIRGIEI